MSAVYSSDSPSRRRHTLRLITEAIWLLHRLVGSTTSPRRATHRSPPSTGTRSAEKASGLATTARGTNGTSLGGSSLRNRATSAASAQYQLRQIWIYRSAPPAAPTWLWCARSPKERCPPATRST